MTNGMFWQARGRGVRGAQARYDRQRERWSRFARSIKDPGTGGGTSDPGSPLLQGRAGRDFFGAKFAVSATRGQDESTVPG